MNTKDLLKEAIADAKAVRETALAQAKLALEESFMPRLTSMFNARLQEKMDDLEEKDNMIDELDGEMVDEAEVEIAKKAMEELSEIDVESYDDDGNTVEEIDLEEILAELGDMDKDDLKEAKEEEIEAEEDVEDMEDDEEEDEEEEKEVKELSMDELEELIRDIVSQEMGGDGEADMDVDASMDMDMDMTDELPDTTDDEVVDIEEVNLDEILAELLGEEIELTEGKKRNKYGGNKGDVPASKRGDKKDTAEEEGVEDYKKKKKSLNEANIADITAMITGLAVSVPILFNFFKALKGKTKDEQEAILKSASNAMAGAKGISEDLEETINTLREELQEVNLLNAKLLYVNKIFKSKNLNESQKIKVIQAFDKAESAKEAKLVYESLNENFAAKSGKATIKESLGFASKAAGVAPQKQTIVESNEFIARMKKLANIK
jgi:hypothetical protein